MKKRSSTKCKPMSEKGAKPVEYKTMTVAGKDGASGDAVSADQTLTADADFSKSMGTSAEDKASVLGDAVTVSHDKSKITVTSDPNFSKSTKCKPMSEKGAKPVEYKTMTVAGKDAASGDAVSADQTLTADANFSKSKISKVKGAEPPVDGKSGAIGEAVTVIHEDHDKSKITATLDANFPKSLADITPVLKKLQNGTLTLLKAYESFKSLESDSDMVISFVKSYYNTAVFGNNDVLNDFTENYEKVAMLNMTSEKYKEAEEVAEPSLGVGGSIKLEASCAQEVVQDGFTRFIDSVLGKKGSLVMTVDLLRRGALPVERRLDIFMDDLGLDKSCAASVSDVSRVMELITSFSISTVEGCRQLEALAGPNSKSSIIYQCFIEYGSILAYGDDPFELLEHCKDLIGEREVARIVDGGGLSSHLKGVKNDLDTHLASIMRSLKFESPLMEILRKAENGTRPIPDLTKAALELLDEGTSQA